MSENSLTSNNNLPGDDHQEQQQQVQEQKDQKDNPNNKSVSNQQDKQISSTQSDTSRLLDDRSLSTTKRLKMHSTYRPERIRDSFKSLNVKDIAEQYKKRHVKVSSLSIPEYVDIVNDSALSKVEPIHFLPPIISCSLEQFSYKKDYFGNNNANNNVIGNDRDFSNFAKKKNNPNFVNDDEIKYIHQNIVDLLDHSLQTSRQNWNRYNSTLFNSKSTSRSYQPSPQSTRNSSYLSSISSQLAKKEIIKMQLKHNKSQFQLAKQYNLDEIKKRYNEEIQSSLNFQKKIDQLPPIKHYPSRGKILENMMHMQMVKKIHEANGNIEGGQDKKGDKQSKEEKSLNLKHELGFNLSKIQYKGFWLDKENQGWKPPARETSRCSIYGDKGFLYGGVGMEVLNDFCMINLKTKDWQLLPQKGEYPKEGRFGHSLDVYKKQLIMFGGEKKCSSQSKLKELVNEVRVMNIDTLEWKIQRCSGDQIEYRRDHASAVVGKNLIVHGGISQKNFCNDMFHLDLQFNRWAEANCINTYKIYPEGVAYHTAVPVYFSERKNVQLYKPLEDKHADKFNRLKEEGIYFFGGINHAGFTNNTFAILKTDTKPMHFIIPETLGEAPKSRCKHSMILQDQLEWIVVYGGMNEGSNYQGFLNDMHMLKLDTLIWRQITFYGIDKVGRCGHLSMSYGSQVLIMGGLGAQGIYSMGALEVELDQKTVLKLAQEEVRFEEQKNKKRANSYIDKNLQGQIIKIKQDLNQTEQAMEMQIKIMDSHKESVARLLKKLQFKSQNSFLPIPNQMSDLNHMTSLLAYQNTTNFDEQKIKKKELINKEAEQFNKQDDSLNENLKLTSESFIKSEKSPLVDFRQKVKAIINMKKLSDLKSSKSFLLESPQNQISAHMNPQSTKLIESPPSIDLSQQGFLSPQNSLLKKDATFTQKAMDSSKSFFKKRSGQKAQTTFVKDPHS